MQTTEFNRRKFLGYMSTGLLAVSINPITNAFPDPAKPSNKFPTKEEKTPVPKKNLHDLSERPEGDYSTPVNPHKRIGFAIVGLGNLTLGEILPAFGNCKYAKPVALVSGDPEKAKKVANQYGINEKNIYNYENFDKIKDNAEIDVVYIVLPNGMHHEFTIRAAKAGKHVLCEKPMANSIKECEEMIDACKKANRKLMIAYRIQYEPMNAQCRKWIQTKEMGEVKLLEFHNGQNIGDPSQWRLKKSLAGGGALPDIGIYCLNTCRYLLGQEPEAVYAYQRQDTSDERFKEVEDSMFFHLHFSGGIVASCVTSYSAHVCRRYRAYTDKGAWFGMDPAFAYKGLKLEVSQVKDKFEWNAHPFMEEKDQFALEMDHMAECIYDDKRPYTGGEEGLQDQRIMEALYKSSREGIIVRLEKISGKDIFRGDKSEEK